MPQIQSTLSSFRYPEKNTRIQDIFSKHIVPTYFQRHLTSFWRKEFKNTDIVSFFVL